MGLAIFAAAVALNFIDWDRYKGPIVAHLSKELGHQLSVDGDIALSVFPYPSFSLTGVRIANVEGASRKDMVLLKSLDVQVAFMPLITGVIEVRKIVLVEPNILFERLSDGRTNWTAFGPGINENNVESSSTFPKITFSKVRIEDGSLTFLDGVNGTSEHIDEIELTISAPRLDGPFDFSGMLKFRGGVLKIRSAMVEVMNGQRSAINGNFSLNGLEINLSANSNRSRVPFIDGKLSVESAGTGEFLNFIEQVLPVQIPTSDDADAKLSGNSQFSYHRGTLQISSLAFRLGSIAGTGSAQLPLSIPINFDVELALGRVDLDSLLALLPTLDDESSKSGQATDMVGSTDAGWLSFIFPEGIAGTLAVRVDAMLYRSQAIRDLRVDLGVASNVININEVSALFPGGSNLTFFGSVTPKEGMANLSGEIDGESDNFRGLLKWLEVDVSSVPADRLRRVMLSGTVDGTRSSGTVTDIDLYFDASHLVGGVAYAINRGRAGFGIGLHLDQLNLDAYLPVFFEEASVPDGKEAIKDDLQNFVPVPDGFSYLVALRDSFPFDADFDIRLNNFTAGGIPANGLVLDGLLQQNKLELHQISIGDLSGATLSLSGSVSGLDGAPHVDGAINFSTERLTSFSRIVPAVSDLSAIFHGPIRVDTKVTGSFAKIDLEGEIATHGSTLGFNGTFPDPLNFNSFDISTDFQSSDLGEFLATVTKGEPIGVLADMELDAPIAVNLAATGTLSNFDIKSLAKFAEAELTIFGSISNFTEEPEFQVRGEFQHSNLSSLAKFLSNGIDGRVSIPKSPIRGEVNVQGLLDQLQFQATLDFSEIAVDFSGTIEGLPAAAIYKTELNASHPNLNSLLRNFGVPQGSVSAEPPLNLKATVHAGSEFLSVSDLTVELADTKASGTVEVDLEGDRPRIVADLEVNHLMGEQFFVPLVMSTRQQSPPATSLGPSKSQAGPREVDQWSADMIGFKWMEGFDAHLKLGSQSVTMSHFNFNEARLEILLENNSLTIENLVAEIFDGELQVSGKIDPRTTPTIRLSTRLAGANIHDLLFELAGVDAVAGKINLETTITAQGRSRKEWIASLNGDGLIENVGEGTISGLDLRAFSDQIGELNVVGDFIHLAEIALEQGDTRYTELEGNFNIVNGELQTTDLRLVADGGVGTVTGMVDLAKWRQDLLLTFQLINHPDIPPFKLRLQGSPNEPNRGIETIEFEKYLLAKGIETVIKETQSVGDSNPAGAIIERVIEEVRPQSATDNVRGIADDLIDELLGGRDLGAETDEPSPERAPTSGSSPTEDEGEDLFKDLIERLLRE